MGGFLVEYRALCERMHCASMMYWKEARYELRAQEDGKRVQYSVTIRRGVNYSKEAEGVGEKAVRAEVCRGTVC